MKKKLIGISLLAISLMSQGAEISLKEAIEKATKNNYEMKSVKKDIANIKLQKKQAYKAVLPKVDYSGSYAKMQEKMDPTESNSDNLYQHSINLTQAIYNGGNMWTAIKIAGIYDGMAGYNLLAKKDEIEIQVIESYVGIIKLEKQLEILKNSLKEIEGNYKKVKEFYELGMVTKTSLLEMEYSKIELESNIIAIENNILISKLRFKNDLGINESEKIELKDLKLDNIKENGRELEEDIKVATKNNLNIKLLEMNLKAQKQNEKIAKSKLLPKINLQFSYASPNKMTGKAYELTNSIKLDDWEWSAGISFSMNLWDWGSNIDGVSIEKNNTGKMEYSKKQNENNIKLGIRSLYYEMERLTKLLEAKERGVLSAKENYEMEKEKLEEKITTTTDFLAAENRLRQSEIDILETKMDYFVAKEKYNNMIGEN
ncbi:MAG: hypothetical protein B6I28_01475 [Fusobacteriia bacterium 4572_132]|nr:MAG: hypothetical protein B6I28_01475 [Fusobacteriia bacterium 4572_132]